MTQPCSKMRPCLRSLKATYPRERDDRSMSTSQTGEEANPAVSVIIPAYNVAPFIRETLDSVFVQTFTDFEVIVINDDSPDTTQLEQELERYCGRVVYLKK